MFEKTVKTLYTGDQKGFYVSFYYKFVSFKVSFRGENHIYHANF